MHNLSRATGLALARLVIGSNNDTSGGSDDLDELADQIAEFAEEARLCLKLDGAVMCNAVMFTQPLIDLFSNHWRFALVVGVCLSAKYSLEGFFIGDIIEHWTDEFPLNSLITAERLAFRRYLETMDNMELRQRTFRNALLSVVIEEPVPGAEIEEPATVPGESIRPPNVLIVDDSGRARELHRALVLAACPGATVLAASTIQEAISQWNMTDHNHMQIDLVLLDYNMTSDPDPADEVTGFDVAKAIFESRAPGSAPRPTFTYLPLVVMVTAHAERAISVEPVDATGIFGGCSALVAKPLNTTMVRALIEASVI